MRRAAAVAFAASVLAGCKVASVGDNAAPRERHVVEPTAGRALEEPRPPETPPSGPAARESSRFWPLGASAGDGDAPSLAKDGRPRDAVRAPDRWRVGFPSWDRGSKSDSPYDASSPIDPYHQNWLKGDYPIPGTQNTFVIAEFESVTRGEAKKLPIPSSVFTSSLVG